jgi:hypothetical protein
VSYGQEPAGAVRARPRAPLIGCLVVAAWALLLAAWLLANPPFAAPDEADHYIRAVGIGEGHLIGRRDPTSHLGITARQVAWTRQTGRLVSLPAGLDPRPFSCQTGSGHLSAACLNSARANPAAVTLLTGEGNYPPLPYLLPAAIMRAASSPPGALRLARAAGALVALALLAVALAACYDGADPVLSILGVLLAVTPMALFCAASLNSSGLEIASAIAFFACLLRLLREQEIPPRWWAATALSGGALALTRSAGPLWVAIVVGVALAGGAWWPAVRGWLSNRAAWVAAGGVAIAVVLNRVWESLYGVHVPFDTSSLHAGLVAGARQSWRALPELVGKFGYLDVKLPLVLPLVWLAMLLGLLGAAGRGRRTERVTLLVLVLTVGVVPIAFYALLVRPTGFGLQDRWLLPVFVTLPLLAGEVCRRHRARLHARTRSLLVLAVPIGVAVVQFAAWYANSKRFAVGGEGPTWFLADARWSPPGGWAICTASAALGAVCLAAVVLLERRTRGAPEPQA